MKAATSAMAATNFEWRLHALHADSRSVAIDFSRRAATYQIARRMIERIAIGSGDRIETRKPPAVVRKPPLTAKRTATAISAAEIQRKARLPRCLVCLSAYFFGIVQK